MILSRHVRRTTMRPGFRAPGRLRAGLLASGVLLLVTAFSATAMAQAPDDIKVRSNRPGVIGFHMLPVRFVAIRFRHQAIAAQDPVHPQRKFPTPPIFALRYAVG